MKQIIEISGRECLFYTEGEKPKVLLIQTLGAQERGSIDDEVKMIREMAGVSFVMAAFAIGDWEAELTPWHDPAVSKRQDVGKHAFDTLDYITKSLIPYLKEQFGTLPVVLGIRDDDLLSVLRKESPVAENCQPTRIVYDSDQGGIPVRDKPVSFSQLHRQYGFRMKKEELLKRPEHDPMTEL